MSKKILTFFVLLCFFFIGFIHNSMMAFAISHNVHETHSVGIKDVGCPYSNNKNKKKCIDTFITIKAVIQLNTNFNGPSFKINIPSFNELFSLSIFNKNNKKLIKNHSPPNIKSKVKYYSYSDLIKVIKSNT